MNLLSLIIIFLAIVICVAVGYIAWELTADKPPAKPGQANDTDASPNPGDGAGHPDDQQRP